MTAVQVLEWAGRYGLKWGHGQNQLQTTRECDHTGDHVLGVFKTFNPSLKAPGPGLFDTFWPSERFHI